MSRLHLHRSVEWEKRSIGRDMRFGNRRAAIGQYNDGNYKERRGRSALILACKVLHRDYTLEPAVIVVPILH